MGLWKQGHLTTRICVMVRKGLSQVHAQWTEDGAVPLQVICCVGDDHVALFFSLQNKTLIFIYIYVYLEIYVALYVRAADCIGHVDGGGLPGTFGGAGEVESAQS